MSDEFKCWYVNDGQCWMFGYGKTRSQAIKWFLDRYAGDADFSDYVRGDIRVTTMRIPEFDGHPEVDHDEEAVLKRGKMVWCPQCDYEQVVAGPPSRWWDDPDIRFAYKAEGRVMCHVCAEQYPAADPIRADWGYKTSFERYRDVMMEHA